MTLPTSMLRQLRNAHITMGMSTTISLEHKTAGAFGAASSITVEIISDETTEEFGERTGEKQLVRRVTARPLQDATCALGDRFTYGAVLFLIEAISGIDVPRWVGVYRTGLGAAARDAGIRAAGGGT